MSLLTLAASREIEYQGKQKVGDGAETTVSEPYDMDGDKANQVLTEALTTPVAVYLTSQIICPCCVFADSGSTHSDFFKKYLPGDEAGTKGEFNRENF